MNARPQPVPTTARSRRRRHDDHRSGSSSCVIVGITAIDAGSIAFTKFRLADVASSASTAAANAFQRHGERELGLPGRGRPPSLTETRRRSWRRRAAWWTPRRHRHDHVRKEAKTIIAGRLSFTKTVHEGDRHRDQRADRPVALSRVTDPEATKTSSAASSQETKQAFAILVERHQTRVFNVALRVFGRCATTRATRRRTRSCRCCESSRSSAATRHSPRGSTGSP